MAHKTPRPEPVLIRACSGTAVALAALCLTPLVGSTTIDYARAFAGVSPDHEILFDTRLPRVLLALLAGGALAVAGVLFQALLRDALATPYTLGVSSGASLGAVTGHLPRLARNRASAGRLGGAFAGAGAGAVPGARHRHRRPADVVLHAAAGRHFDQHHLPRAASCSCNTRPTSARASPSCAG